jgi:hypothetical protein
MHLERVLGSIRHRRVQTRGVPGGSKTDLLGCIDRAFIKADVAWIALYLMPAVLEPTSKRLQLSLLRCAVPIVYQISLVSFVVFLETRRA